MADFFLKIAGYTGAVQSLFESTPVYLKNYLAPGSGDFSVKVTREAIDTERRLSVEEALEEGYRIRNFPDTYLERAYIQRCFADFLFERQVLMFHGSVVAVDGRAYLFTANSGVGKSTHTRLWRQLLGDRAVMINDDKPFLQLGGDTVMVHGSPWSGKHGLDTNMAAPLQGICLLQRGSEDSIRPATAEQLRAMAEKQSHHLPEDRDFSRLRRMTEQLLAQVPLWQMSCTKEITAAELAYAAMSRES